jgi:hypothetical protein
MSLTLDSIIESIDEPVIVQLKNRAFDSFDDPAPFDATGKTISLELCGCDGVAVVTSGKVVWEDEALSKARFNRDADDLSADLSPYRARWFVADGDGTHPYPSTSAPDIWVVVKAV